MRRSRARGVRCVRKVVRVFWMLREEGRVTRKEGREERSGETEDQGKHESIGEDGERWALGLLLKAINISVAKVQFRTRANPVQTPNQTGSLVQVQQLHGTELQVQFAVLATVELQNHI